MSQTIALAIDFKKFTNSVLETGLFLKEKLYPESKIVLFHVIEFFFTPPHYLIPYFKEEENRLKTEFLNLSQKFKNKNIPVETEVIFGNFWEALKNFVKNLNPHLLVLGYQPYRFKIPTAEKILERVKSNFLVVKDSPLQEIKKVLCCIDFSENSLPSLKMANFISKKLGAQLIVLNVISEIKIKNHKLKEEILEEKRAKRNELWNNLLNSLEEAKKEVFNFQIKYGKKTNEILKTINEFSPDLLIIGKTGKIVEFGLGSVTKELLKRVSIPILIAETI
ncbi:UspA domain-containing protein [Thermodesulfobacterium geofontis OPF15]|uniref:UspA domain-containing protein n=1 Tax=Thermodesulfobacterium geofontis (strain OPF15) TaxID=795359 RepID=F8C613_THEGP|nr:universal stress protein [Thermodesulfobacterium geofontis]AEH23156.1 UspA domain-containing protein [Thermodesulfobacterium geofontis OPF15]